MRLEPFYRLLFPNFGRALVAVFCLFTLGCISLSTVSDHKVVYHIDGNVWTRPVKYKQVSIWFDFDPDEGTAFGRKLNQHMIDMFKDGLKVAFGRSRGRPVIVVRNDMVPHMTPLSKFAISAHESFHSLVGYNALRPRYDTVFTPQIGEKKQRVLAGKLAYDLYVSLKNESDVCRSIMDILQAPDVIRRYFIAVTYTEWTAEWYMRHSSLRGLSFQKYLELRTKWGNGRPNYLYVSGVLAVDDIDGFYTRNKWQKSYMNGAHPINLLSNANGCHMYIPDSFQVDSGYAGKFWQN